ncbi:putative membrane protein YdfJ with MMPL/SSD domain [Streptomyces albogriseolus]
MGNGDTRVRGLAARAGGWSARHRWAAVGIWVLFVVLAMGLGSAAGRVDVEDSEQLKGETGTAARIIEEAGIEEPASETVLVQAKDAGLTSADAEFRSAVAAVMTAVERTGEVTDVTSPYDSGTVSKDGRSALVQFDVRGDPQTAGERIEPVLDAVADVQKEHGALRIEEIGGASMMKTFDDAFGDDFKKAEYSAVPVALGILLIAFGRAGGGAAAGRPGDHRDHGDDGPDGARQPPPADERHRQLGDAAGGSGRRRRLLPLLPAP